MDTTDAPQMMEHIHKSITFTPNDTRWVPCSARFVVTGIHPRAKGALVVRVRLAELDEAYLCEFAPSACHGRLYLLRGGQEITEKQRLPLLVLARLCRLHLCISQGSGCSLWRECSVAT